MSKFLIFLSKIALNIQDIKLTRLCLQIFTYSGSKALLTSVIGVYNSC